MKVRDEAFQYYFYFMQERMNIFWKRYEGITNNFTNDKILAVNKFTNVYRAQDRTSQYLIQEVIYGDRIYDDCDVLFRILFFKIFNNIDTWIYLQDELGDIKISNFDVDVITRLLANRIKFRPIFSGAYMMTGSHSKYVEYPSKHEKWMQMLKREIVVARRLERIIEANSLKEVFEILSECSFIGSFLAYQYAIDLNYSEVIDFDENSFVRAGIGAIRGIKKCFTDIDRYSFEACIRFTQENLESFQQKYGYTSFRPLFSRNPTLIDLQNCFCETDKYLRVKLPELQVDNMRIKQKFQKPKAPIQFFFPPKWNINQYVQPCTSNTKELTLF